LFYVCIIIKKERVMANTPKEGKILRNKFKANAAELRHVSAYNYGKEKAPTKEDIRNLLRSGDFLNEYILLLEKAVLQAYSGLVMGTDVFNEADWANNPFAGEETFKPFFEVLEELWGKGFYELTDKELQEIYGDPRL
jgi:hypothetical protein